MVDRLPVIIGLDALKDNEERISKLVKDSCSHVSGYKIGLPNILAGLNVRGKVVEHCSDSLLIADLKLADISDTMIKVASYVIDWADAVIAHSFPGFHGALDGLSEYLQANNKKLIVVVSMSNPGASDTMDPILDKLVSIALRAGSWGVIAPATRPDIIRRVRRMTSTLKILSPGIGFQGARPGSAVGAGADYEIIGRLITLSSDPVGTLMGIRSFYELQK